MKKYIISVFILSCSFLSCSDFLDRGSLSSLSSDIYWSDEQDATSGLVGCYDALQSVYYTYWSGSACPRDLEFATDNGYCAWGGWMDPAPLTTNTLNPTSSLVTIVWKSCYRGIARCNDVIYHVPIMQSEGKIKKEVGDKIYAEAKFLRAYYYSHLISLYRDVPLTLDILTPETSQMPKSPKAKVVEQIVNDLKEVSLVLPETNMRGRATKGAALALLCRTYLYNEMYTEAADAAQQVINLNKYIIDPSYENLFTEAGNLSQEVIFSVRFKDLGASGGEGGLYTYNYGSPMDWFAPYKNLANDYYCKDGKPITTSPLYNPDNDSTRDTRLTYNLVTPSSTWEGMKVSETNWFNSLPLNHFVRKHQNKKFPPSYGGDSQDFYVIRYADVLLMRAEALAKLSRNNTEIMGLINQVRQRPDVMMPKVEDAEGSGLSFDQLLEIVKHERRVELAFEGQRYFDLLRWKGMEAAYARCRNEKVDGVQIGGSHDFDSSKGYVWPIAQTELDDNKALVQAPEWGGK